MSPFVLPDGNVQIGLSGGRTSAYMLWRIIEANPPWPNDRVKVIFANTGREMNETLDFVRDIELQFGVPIIWIEYDATSSYRQVDHSTASRDGRPFEDLIRKRQYLPNVVTRFCTQELKIRTAKRYLVDIGWKRWTSAIGIRADEPTRIRKEKPKDRWDVWYPLADAGITKAAVSAFWKSQPFDLQLENINGTTPFGNCDGCFLKADAKIAELQRQHPERAAWWEKMEREIGASFSKRYQRSELREFITAQGDWIFDMEDALCQKDGGECME